MNLFTFFFDYKTASIPREKIKIFYIFPILCSVFQRKKNNSRLYIEVNLIISMIIINIPAIMSKMGLAYRRKLCTKIQVVIRNIRWNNFYPKIFVYFGHLTDKGRPPTLKSRFSSNPAKSKDRTPIIKHANDIRCPNSLLSDKSTFKVNPAKLNY